VSHTGSVVQVEQDILAAGAQIIWVLEANGFGQPGTPEDCRNFVDAQGSNAGWCVGDGETIPVPLTFDNSPFSIGRGFDIIVPRSTMEIVYATNHGTPDGNENITGEELLAEIQMVADSL
jgi:hypothetical protein